VCAWTEEARRSYEITGTGGFFISPAPFLVIPHSCTSSVVSMLVIEDITSPVHWSIAVIVVSFCVGATISATTSCRISFIWCLPISLPLVNVIHILFFIKFPTIFLGFFFPSHPRLRDPSYSAPLVFAAGTAGGWHLYRTLLRL
jgi:hypothetical protein